MASTWTLPERHLIAELASGISRRLFAILGPTGDGVHIGSGYVSHIYTSDFENGCDVLWRLGLAYAAYGPEPKMKEISYQSYVHGKILESKKIWPPYFKFFESCDIWERLSVGPTESAPPFEKILSAYLRVACDYGPDGSSLSSRRDPFEPQLEYTKEI